MKFGLSVSYGPCARRVIGGSKGECVGVWGAAIMMAMFLF